MSDVNFYIGEVVGDAYQSIDNINQDVNGVYYIDVLTYPDGILVRKVQIPRTLSVQVIPQVNNMVLIMKQDEFSSNYIMTLKDSADPKNNPAPPLRRENTGGGKDFHRPGEIHFESIGGSYLNLDNSGSVSILAADSNEKIVLDNVVQQVRIEGLSHLITNKTDFSIVGDKLGNLVINKINPITKTAITTITLDIAGNININSTTGDVNLSCQNININAAQNINMKGLAIKIGNITKKLVTNTFLKLFNSHTHIAGTLANGGGPVAGITGNPVIAADDFTYATNKTEAE